MRGNAFLVLAAALSGAFSAGAGEPVRSYMIVAQPRDRATVRVHGDTLGELRVFCDRFLRKSAESLCFSPRGMVTQGTLARPGERVQALVNQKHLGEQRG
jgi:hypothetical protein